MQTGADRQDDLEAGLELAAHEKRLIEEALRRCGGNKVRSARLLGISRDALRRRMQRHGIGK